MGWSGTRGCPASLFYTSCRQWWSNLQRNTGWKFFLIFTVEYITCVEGKTKWCWICPLVSTLLCSGPSRTSWRASAPSSGECSQVRPSRRPAQSQQSECHCCVNSTSVLSLSLSSGRPDRLAHLPLSSGHPEEDRAGQGVLTAPLPSPPPLPGRQWCNNTDQDLETDRRTDGWRKRGASCRNWTRGGEVAVASVSLFAVDKYWPGNIFGPLFGGRILFSLRFRCFGRNREGTQESWVGHWQATFSRGRRSIAEDGEDARGPTPRLARRSERRRIGEDGGGFSKGAGCHCGEIPESPKPERRTSSSLLHLHAFHMSGTEECHVLYGSKTTSSTLKNESYRVFILH